MKVKVAHRVETATIFHPNSAYSTFIDNFNKYLDDNFNDDHGFLLPKSSVLLLTARVTRRSRFSCRGRGSIILDLQPAIDVAQMVASAYWQSDVWAARITFDLLHVIEEICIGNCLEKAAAFAKQFAANRLSELITSSKLAEPEKPIWLAWRRSQFIGLDEQALAQQLAFFQAFHEIAHFSHFLLRPDFHVGNESDELLCDDFACSELDVAYEDITKTEFGESYSVTAFLSMTIWILADNIAQMGDSTIRRQVFSMLNRRYKAASMQVDRYCWKYLPLLEKNHDKLFREFATLDEIVRVLEMFIDEALEYQPSIFDDVSSSNTDLRQIKVPKKSWLKCEFECGEEMSKIKPAWQSVWEKEDQAEQLRFEIWKQHAAGRPLRSRPMYTDMELGGPDLPTSKKRSIWSE